VLLDLASAECIEPLRRSFEFPVISGKRGYSVREITKQTPHPIMRAERLTIYAWGTILGKPAFLPDARFEDLRLSQGEDAEGKWLGWRMFPNSDNLEVTPPAGDDDAFDEDTDAPIMAQLVAIVHPRAYQDDDDLTEIHAEDIPCVVAGLVKWGAPFGDETLQTMPDSMVDYEQLKREVWGRRHNGRTGRVIGSII
jgi:hypothetical protein